MAGLRSSNSNFWLVAAPTQNFEGKPTINVAGHEVPVPVYWELLDLVEHGRSQDDIVQDVVRHTGTKNLNIVGDIINSVAENQRLLSGRIGPQKSSNRFSVTFKKPKQLSDNRASRIEARRELEAVQEKLETTKQTEKKLLNEAMILSQRKEDIKELKMTPDQRRKTIAAVEQQIKQVLEKHRKIEAEIDHGRRLTAIHKGSLA